MTIGEIAEYFPQNRSVISRHLDFMNRFNIVQRRKEGREVYYKANKKFIVDSFEETANNMKALMNDIDSALSGFIVGRVLVNLALGVLMFVGFLLIGLPYALLLTLMAVVLNFIPFIGAIVSTIPIFIIGLIESPSTAIWSIIVVLVAQQIQDNLVAPYIFGKSLDIHPLTTIILVLAGGDFGGIIGILLIIPVYMILKIIVVKLYQLFIRQRNTDEPQSAAADAE